MKRQATWRWRQSIIVAAVCAPTVALAMLFVVERGAHGADTATSAPSITAAQQEPTTNPPVMPRAGGETPMPDPFTAPPRGPVQGEWSYNQLSVDDRAGMDRERAETAKRDWASTHAGFERAVGEQAKRAAATSAARQLGIDNLGGLGVVP
jgi:hypothetical protein